MTPTFVSSSPLTRRRRPIVALLASLCTAALVLTAAPGAVASGTPSTAATTVTAEVQDEAEPTFDGLHALVQKNYDAGEISTLLWARLRARLRTAEWYYDEGFISRAVLTLEGFKREVNDPRHEATQAARDELVAAADELIDHISATH